MLEHLSDLRLFAEVCRTLNFREAGERLGYSPAITTMRIQRLEGITGRTLFIRTTRHVRLTDEGRELLHLTEKMLDLSELMSMSKKLEDMGHELQGTVRIASPHSFARIFLIEPIRIISQEHPLLNIELLLDDNITKLAREGIDISFRVGGQEEVNMNATDILDDKVILVASPDYLKNNGAPKEPNDLREHYCLSYASMKEWKFHKKNQRFSISPKYILHCNTGDYLAKLAVAGAGITLKSNWSVQDELKSGQLVNILPDYLIGEPRKVRVLTPKRDIESIKVKYVLNTIQSHIKNFSK